MPKQTRSDPASSDTANAAGTVPEDHVAVMGNKTPSKYTDPCAKAAKLSMRCLEDNQYDRRACADIFNNYRECKKAWVLQRRHDRLAGREGA